jgi:hypothetical protein
MENLYKEILIDTSIFHIFSAVFGASEVGDFNNQQAPLFLRVLDYSVNSFTPLPDDLDLRLSLARDKNQASEKGQQKSEGKLIPGRWAIFRKGNLDTRWNIVSSPIPVMEINFTEVTNAGLIIQFTWVGSIDEGQKTRVIDFVDKMIAAIEETSEVRDVSPENIDYFASKREINQANLKRERLSGQNTLEKIRNQAYMKQFYADYSPRTALKILEAIPKAWAAYNEAGGRWGPQKIAEQYDLDIPTMSRYLKAFWMAGLREFEHEGEKIPNPYKPRE